MILYGLASLIKRINDSIYYSASLDEALNSVIQKCQMDINIIYCGITECKVKTRCFNPQFLERPNAYNLLDRINLSSAKLSEDSFLHVAIDGPNVNWNVLHKLDNKLVEDGFSKTPNIGSCAQHVHGAFQTGSCNTWWNLDKIFKRMFYIFQDSPARRETFKTASGTVYFLYGSIKNPFILFFQWV